MTKQSIEGAIGDSTATRSDTAGTPELLTFKCGGQGYAVDIMSVREIRSWSEPTPLPHAPPFMRGMVNLRGSVLPVMDLAQRMGQARTPDDPRSVIIVIQQNNRVHGLLVDAVSDIVHPSLDQLQDVPRVTAGDQESMAEQLFVVDETMVQVLSTARILPKVETNLGSPAA
ncbi:purine-binding chemotaxis protein CheW [Jannaschia faecimaris]|uniref:Purine-binding chemotaxis protein CheW n=1 Tax=Jannaschia faecimaris TaxID=1244108 RepID=A0A1H3T8S0_9RHOB|nr:chemotaxis protein CheW [Jannaschia faecimaris]SDZ46626.1 purine-binding chemotaxis protein CheW [Jannaschia faecimaris]